MPDYDNAEVGKDRNEPRILKDKARGAGKDGFTTIARRVRGDQPGYWMDAAEADDHDRMMNEGGPPFFPGGYGY